jgi:hypothetical protein
MSEKGDVQTPLVVVWRGFGRTVIRANYFNNLKKCYEPLLEPLSLSLLLEKSPVRGSGAALKTGSRLHLNVSGALIIVLEDVLRMVQLTPKYVSKVYIHIYIYIYICMYIYA